MKLDTTKLGLSTGVAFGVVWVICSLLIVIAPNGVMQLTGYMLHSDLGNLGWTMSWAGFFAGLVAWSVLAGVLAWAAAAIYNRLID